MGGLEVAILLPGSYLHLHLQPNSTTQTHREEKVVLPTLFKIPSFNSIKVNTPYMIQLLK